MCSHLDVLWGPSLKQTACAVACCVSSGTLNLESTAWVHGTEMIPGIGVLVRVTARP